MWYWNCPLGSCATENSQWRETMQGQVSMTVNVTKFLNTFLWGDRWQWLRLGVFHGRIGVSRATKVTVTDIQRPTDSGARSLAQLFLPFTLIETSLNHQLMFMSIRHSYKSEHENIFKIGRTPLKFFLYPCLLSSWGHTLLVLCKVHSPLKCDPMQEVREE